jgi:superfamily II DNA or RNA helicase
MTAINAGWLWVRVDQFESIEHLKSALTYIPLYDEEQKPVRLYNTSRLNRGYLGIPRAYGLGLAHQMNMPVNHDRLTDGDGKMIYRRLPDPNHPSVQDPAAQKLFMENMLIAAQQTQNFIAQAPTGSGKTVVALRTAALLGRRTMVLCHLERIMDQWVDTAKGVLGLTDDEIGIAQQDRFDHDKPLTVGMLHSVAQRDYGPDFYRAFGTLIVDEVHKIGSGHFAQAVPRFPARIRFGLSATPKRKDGGDRVFFWHLGPITVSSTAEAMPCNLYVLPYATQRPLWGKAAQSRVKCLSLDRARNEILVSAIKRMHDQGRVVLAVSHSVTHVQEMIRLAIQRGIPHNVIGQYTGERHVKVEDGQNADGSTKYKIKKVKVKKEEFERIKASSQIIFATYGMMTEGVDIQRLDAGIDLTPRGQATQLIGRIRRPLPDKPTPLWITPLDIHCQFSKRWFKGRLTDYEDTGVNILNREAIRSYL